MRVGVAQAEITPAVGTDICGFVAREQPSVGALDPLLATALYLESGGEPFVVLHAEALGHERSDVLRLAAALAERGIGKGRLLVTATHTHSGPPIVRLAECGAYSSAEVARLHEAFLRLFEQARAGADEAVLVFGEGQCDLGIDRRGGPHAHVDRRIPAFGWKRPDGTWAAALCVCTLHNVAMGPESRAFSGDVFGEAARRLSARIGAPAILLNGACGNINPPSVGSDYARVVLWGGQVAEAAEKALLGATEACDEEIVCAEGTVEAARRAATLEQEQAVRTAADGAGDGPVASRVRRAHARWLESAESRHRAETAITAVRLGPAYLSGIGAEVFSVIGDELRAATGLPVYPVGYANGDAGYVAPEFAYAEGGYEVEGAFVYYGSNPVECSAFERIRVAAASLLREVSR